MHTPHPVAVEIKPVVIGAPVGPRFVVLHIGRFLTTCVPLYTIVPVYIAITAVGVDAYKQDDDRLLQPVGSSCISSSSHPPGQLESRFGSGGLIAVNVIAEGHKDRLIFG